MTESQTHLSMDLLNAFIAGFTALAFTSEPTYSGFNIKKDFKNNLTRCLYLTNGYINVFNIN